MKSAGTGIEFDNIKKYSRFDRDVIDGYLEAVDPVVLSTAEMYKTNKSAPNKRIKIASVSDRLAKDIKDTFEIDVVGYTVWADRSTFTHIEKRHGENGKHDQSMADLNDVARMGFIVENYDSIEWCMDQNGNTVYSKAHNGANGKSAPVMLLKKRINGVYYLSEAVAENTHKKIWIGSAYINKKGVTQATDAIGRVDTSETSPASSPNQTIPQPTAKIKTSSENSSGNTVDDGKSVNRGRSYEERNSNQAKHTDNPGIRFSLKDVSAADVETLRRGNRKLTEALDAAKAQLKLTKGKRQIKPGAFAAYARKILKDIKSSYSVETLTENLSRLWDSMEAAAESPSPEAAVNVIEQQGIAMAKAALEKSRELDTTTSELYDDVRRYLRETPVKLTEIQRQEAAYQMDSYGMIVWAGKYRKDDIVTSILITPSP